MKRLRHSNKGLKTVIAVLALMLFASVGAKSYCDFYQVSYGNNMYINLVMFDNNVIQKWDCERDGKGNIYYDWYYSFFPAANWNPSYRDIDPNNPVIKAKKGTSYDMTLYGGNYYIYYDDYSSLPENVSVYSDYNLDYAVYIDLNQDGEFDESERVGSHIYYDDYNSWDGGGTLQVYIPDNAKSGKTRMRVVCDYYAFGGGNMDACNSYYGEARDFAVEIVAGYDAGIAKISSPSNPLTLGQQPVKAVLRNYGSNENPLTFCTINWTVDGVYQSTYYWYGTLYPGEETEVTLGNYNFKSKGAVTKYTINAYTGQPNYQNDENTGNDAAPSLSLSVPLSPGIFTVGGTKPDFVTLADAVNYLNSAGTLGNGDLTFNIRPGTYAGPYTMNDFKHGTNNFTFQADPATPGSVEVTSNPNPANYVWLINNIPNVTFRNLIFTASDPNGWGGRIFVIRNNADNYTFENNTFNGMRVFTQTLYTYTLIDCEATQMNNHKYIQNSFNDGFLSLVLINANRNSSGLQVYKNTFKNYTNRAVHVEGISKAVISSNVITGSTKVSSSAIYVHNGTEITDNTISGVKGNNDGGFIIAVIHDIESAPAIITNNSITDCKGIGGIMAYGIDGGEISKNAVQLTNTNITSTITGIQLVPAQSETEKVIISDNVLNVENGYGIYAVNYAVDILKNSVTVYNTGTATNLASLYSATSNGFILLNELFSTDEAMEINNSTYTVAYNSTIATGKLDAVKIQAGANKVFRNQFVNKADGNGFMMLAANNALLDGNNYYSETGTAATIAGVTYTDRSGLLPLDKDAQVIDPAYKANDQLLIARYKDELAFMQPLKNIKWPAGYQVAYEETTFDGFSREGIYYVGAYNNFAKAILIGFSDELIDCAGSENRSLYISAITTDGEEPNFQWYKDGDAMPGETSHILNFTPFDYTVSATYTCSARTGGSKVWTGPIPVYSLTMPEVIEQPNSVINTKLGSEYTFTTQVHYRGLIPPYYKDYFQWYKYDAVKKDSVPLVNDSRIAGATSSLLSIRNLKSTDICKPGDYYFVRVEGQCGVVYSNPFVISQTPDVIFRDHPENINPCPNSDVVFIANAVAPQGFTVTYKWKKDGVDITNGTKYNGVNTNKLQVFNVDANDQGSYVCEATIPEVPVSKLSNTGKLTLKDIPTATVIGNSTITVKRGSEVSMKINLTKGSEPLTVKWYYNGELLKEGLWSIYDGNVLLTVLLEGVNESQSGEYKCVLENECDKTEVIYNLTVTKWDEQSVEVISENGYTLYANYPNPAKGMTTIRFEMPQTDNVVITLIDATGRKITDLFTGVANKGMNSLQINTDNLNVANGTYFYMLSTSGFNATMPMVIVK